ncbi:MAG: anthranilate synthase component I family protein [Candidatus Bilamarchaeaceae archaeon]
MSSSKGSLGFDTIPLPLDRREAVAVELVPAPDPWDVVLKLAHLPNLAFLDSAARHPIRGRYSYVTADPVRWYSARCAEIYNSNPFVVINELLPRNKVEPIHGLPPFQAGLIGVLGYGLNRILEPRIPANKYDCLDLPDIVIGVYDWVIAFDHICSRCWVIAWDFHALQISVEKSGDARHRINEVISWLRSSKETTLMPKNDAKLQQLIKESVDSKVNYQIDGCKGIYSNFDRNGYLRAVQKAIDYINNGDCFQINLSQRLISKVYEHPLKLYKKLRRNNPAPFAAYFDLGPCQLLSASPERFLHADVIGNIETRPIKGTQRRNTLLNLKSDDAEELAYSTKNRSENIMIVDLLRNDLGRVCAYGSISVINSCTIETYEYVHHLVSEIHGRLNIGTTIADLLAATFPGGSVTGAPKVRAMEIIAELEPSERNYYCGALGWFGLDKSLDLSIVIRTALICNGYVQLSVGGGVTSGSTPIKEYKETLLKASGFLDLMIESMHADRRNSNNYQ